MAVAFYPGSFDPFHLGHLDVVEQAVSLFGELVIGVMHNPAKPSGMFNPEERAELIRESTVRPERSFISSTYIRQFANYTGPNNTPLVPAPVLKALVAKQSKGAQ
jgi:cytidyltransferase-like protein